MSQPASPPRAAAAADRARYARARHNVALATLVAGPMLALLPPRKLDVYTLGLCGLTGYSAHHLLREARGRSMWQHVAPRPAPVSPNLEPVAAASPPAACVGERRKEGRGAAAAAAAAAAYAHNSWKATRQHEIREDVAEGKSFGDMITDQIWEVWNQGKKKEEEEEEEEGEDRT